MVGVDSDLSSFDPVRLAIAIVDQQNRVGVAGKVWKGHRHLRASIRLRYKAVGCSRSVHWGERNRSVVEMVLEETVLGVRLQTRISDLRTGRMSQLPFLSVRVIRHA
jgi:hypothetical protein